MNDTTTHLKSRGMIGAWLGLFGSAVTVAGAMGWLPLGITYDPATTAVCIRLDTLAGAFVAGAVPGGAVLAWFGRLFARKRVVGLW